jgi:hypothetical protein
MAQLAVNTTIDLSTAWHSGNYGRTISRGNPGVGNQLLLESVGDVHYYSANGVSAIVISTQMVENAQYELFYQVQQTSGNNIDIVLQPQYSTYGNQFVNYYWCSPNVTTFNQTLSFFYFDHFAGVQGENPCGRFILNTARDAKSALYFGTDSQSIVTGASRWYNNTTQWSGVGILTGFATGNVRVWVRRIS